MSMILPKTPEEAAAFVTELRERCKVANAWGDVHAPETYFHGAVAARRRTVFFGEVGRENTTLADVVILVRWAEDGPLDGTVVWRAPKGGGSFPLPPGALHRMWTPRDQEVLAPFLQRGCEAADTDLAAQEWLLR